MENSGQLINFSIINIDKPSGPTSFQVSQLVRKLFKLNKTSHFGTLDPQVSGVLPVALGRACRLSDYFMHSNKTYIGIMRLHDNVLEEKLKEEIKNFIGKITQMPPVRSRVKRAFREREVKTFEILEIEDKDILFKTEVQAGTYIRKLIHDLGEKLEGAHMLELRRVQASIFEEKDSVSLYELEKAVEEYKKDDKELLSKILIPGEEAIKKVLPVAQIFEKSIQHLMTGKPLTKKDIIFTLPEKERFAAFSGERFLGIYKKVNEKEIIGRAEFVFN